MILRTAALSLTLLVPAAAQAPTWHTDFEAAKALAAKTQKPLLVDFTGSDWCPYCILLDKEVFQTPAFAAAAPKAVLVKLDFPRKSGRTPEALAANPALQKLMDLKDQFQVKGFPTVVLLSPDGKELKRTSGFQKGTAPEAWLKEIGL